MTTVSGDKFGALIREWADKKKLDIEKVARGFCINLSTEIIMRTPVGDPLLWKSKAPAGYTGGRARNNWFATVAMPSEKMNKSADKTGQASVKRVNAGANKLKAGQTFYLTNNLPYIRRLEYEGWSNQAPAGMLRTSLADAEQALITAINAIK